MVHLPDLRLRSWSVGFYRGHYAFDLHLGVRGSPAALRLVSRATRHSSTATDRIRALESHLHCLVQTKIAPACATKIGCRLGCPQNADAGRNSPARLHAVSNP